MTRLILPKESWLVQYGSGSNTFQLRQAGEHTINPLAPITCFRTLTMVEFSELYHDDILAQLMYEDGRLAD